MKPYIVKILDYMAPAFIGFAFIGFVLSVEFGILLWLLWLICQRVQN